MLKNTKLTNIVVSIFDAILLTVCIILACIAYEVASEGFGISLSTKAAADVRALEVVLDLKYPGEWRIHNGILYKGTKCFENLTKDLDPLKQMTGDNITIFKGDS